MAEAANDLDWFAPEFWPESEFRIEEHFKNGAGHGNVDPSHHMTGALQGHPLQSSGSMPGLGEKKVQAVYHPLQAAETFQVMIAYSTVFH